MRAPNIGTMNYVVGQVPIGTDDLQRFLQTELIKIQSALTLLATGHIDMVYVLPTKPREGDIRLADGTQWNPGAGKGVYCYYGAAWHFLG